MMKTSLSEANIRFNPLSNTCDYYTNRWVEMRRVINILEIRKPYNQNIILQIDLNTEEEYVQAGLIFQTSYFPLKLFKKIKKKQKKTTDMSMAEWVGGSSVR